MRKRWNISILLTVAAIMLALVLLPATNSGGCGIKTGPGQVWAGEADQVRKIPQSLGDFRRSVALSLGRVTDRISYMIVGSAGGKLPAALMGKGEGTSDESKTGDATETKTAGESSRTVKKYDPYNVYDYDNADDFAEDYVYEFAEEYYDDESEEDAYDDAYDDACEYWESKHGQ